jgi:hypothetical protein
MRVGRNTVTSKYPLLLKKMLTYVRFVIEDEHKKKGENLF